jgi:hypothetical protein
MDTSVHHFHKSIFSNLEKYWWNGEISWKNKYTFCAPELGRKNFFGINIPVQITDAFHFFKMWMIIFICLSIVFYIPIFNWWIDLCVLGTCWNVTFSLFYNKILLR